MAAGTYTSKGLEPAVTYTLTTNWVNLRDWPEFFQLYPDTAANRALAADGKYPPHILILPGPTGVSSSTPCGSPSNEVEMDSAELVGYLTNREHVVTSTPVAVTVSGLPFQMIDVGVETGWAGCLPGAPIGEVLNPTDRIRFIALDNPNGESLLIRLRAPSDFETFIAEAMPIVESFEFDLEITPSPS